jgi:hypothetical protein
VCGSGGVVERLESLLDEMAGLEPTALGDDETLLALHRQAERITALTTRATGAFDASLAWEGAGARSAAAWLVTRAHLPGSTARRRVRLARALRHMPTVEETWLNGDVGDAQVGLLARTRTPASADAFTRDEAMLVAHAGRLRFRDFARVMSYWRLRADAAGMEDEAERQHDARRLHLSQSFGEAWIVDGLLDPIGGAIVADELRRLTDEAFAADWAEAKARVGDEVRADDLRRTHAQRRADALVEMATRSAAAPAGGRRPAPLFTVLVGYETFAGPLCELANGTVVTPGSLVPYLAEAEIERVVFDGPRRVIDVGVRRRLFRGATRRAVRVRDRECFHPFCDVPAEECEVDHVQPYEAGGPTTQANGRPACGFHNRTRHRRT